LTTLEQWIAPLIAAQGGRSGFRLLANGLDAFVARATLIELAERTLDLQYYIFHPDQSGSLVIDRLVAAADRGVRVRVLLDDWGTMDKNDAAVATLDAHPQIEIRLFNPYIHRTGLGRLAELVTSFTRVNRRMHNKQLIADGVGVVLGGRNIGDEYFSLGELDFQDVDVLAIGPAARQSAQSFESYWNSELAVPVDRLLHGDQHESAVARQALRQRCEQLADSPYAQALAGSSLGTELRSQGPHLHWADARIIADPPEKLNKPPGTRSDTFLGGQLSPYVRTVRSDLLVISPYFVPGKDGVAFFGEQRRRGVDVRVLTNSLAATDVWLVHAGYMKYRRLLLEAGVRLYELRPEAAGAGVKGARASGGMIGSSRASLHAKTFVFDRTSVFIGSVNIDPRSLEQNTEDGVLVESPELATQVADLFDRWASPALSYEVTRGAGGRLQWTGGFTTEPRAGFWRPLGAKFFSHLPIESLI
jgi:cardiolipin synthase C